MKKEIYIRVFLFTVLVLMLASFVATKKFAVSKAALGKLIKENAILKKQLCESRKLLNETQAEKMKTQTMLDSIQRGMTISKRISDLEIGDQFEQKMKLNSLLNLQKNALNNLMYSLEEALINFKDDEIRVFQKEGRVYVSLEEKLLFRSGSVLPGNKGKNALRKIAGILNAANDLTVMIEGHTDNINIRTLRIKDNWDLSTSRATSVVRILTNEYGFDPNRITASGKGKYHPLKSNLSEEGRTANRRTEIILTPNLEVLLKLLYH